MSDERVCAFCWSVVRPASAACPECGLSDDQASAKLVPRPKRQQAALSQEPESISLPSRSSDELARLVVARSGEVTWLFALLGVVAFGTTFGLVGSLAGLVGVLGSFLLGGAVGMAAGLRAGEAVEAGLLLIARDALRRGSTTETATESHAS